MVHFVISVELGPTLLLHAETSCAQMLAHKDIKRFSQIKFWTWRLEWWIQDLHWDSSSNALSPCCQDHLLRWIYDKMIAKLNITWTSTTRSLHVNRMSKEFTLHTLHRILSYKMNKCRQEKEHTIRRRLLYSILIYSIMNISKETLAPSIRHLRKVRFAIK